MLASHSSGSTVSSVQTLEIRHFCAFSINWQLLTADTFVLPRSSSSVYRFFLKIYPRENVININMTFNIKVQVGWYKMEGPATDIPLKVYKQ